MRAWRRAEPRFRPFDDRDVPRRARATVAVAIEEGRLLADYAIRLQLKNRIEVATLGDDERYSAERFAEGAAEELRHLAAEQDAVAERLEAQDTALRGRTRPRHVHDYHVPDRGNLRHRARVARALAEDLRRRAADGDELLALVERARQDAWRDVARVIEQLIDVERELPPDVVDAARASRLADLADELAALAALRDLELDGR